jgi:hypothetical protein
MAFADLKTYDNKVVAKYEVVDVDPASYNITNADGMYTYWKNIYNVGGKETTTVNADDSMGTYTLVTAPPIKTFIPLSTTLALGSEGHLGIFAQASQASIDTASSSAVKSIFGDSRGFLTTSAPLIMFSFHPPTDNKSSNAKIYEGKNAAGESVLLYRTNQSHYSSGANAAYLCFKFDKNGVEVYVEMPSAWGAFNVNMATLVDTASSTWQAGTKVTVLTVSTATKVIKRVNLKTTSYASSGTFKGSTVAPNINKLLYGRMNYTTTTPSGTSVEVKAIAKPSSVGDPNDSEYVPIASGGDIPGLVSGNTIQDYTIWYKIIMSTTDEYATPKVSNISFSLQEMPDPRILQLDFNNANKFRDHVGQLSLEYIAGPLVGSDGPVDNFSFAFNTVGIEPIPTPKPTEYFTATGLTTVTPAVTRINLTTKSVSENYTATGAFDLTVAITRLNII